MKGALVKGALERFAKSPLRDLNPDSVGAALQAASAVCLGNCQVHIPILTGAQVSSTGYLPAALAGRAGMLDTNRLATERFGQI